MKNHSLQPFNQITDDFFQFFTTKQGIDILPYVYFQPSCYEDLIKDYKNYYLFHDEVELINKHEVSLTRHLKDIINLIEIGPGSDHTIEKKTFKIIDYSNNLKNYYAVDHSEVYLQSECSFISKKQKNINVVPVLENVLSTYPSKLKLEGKSALIILGSTFNNFNHIQQNIFFHKIKKILAKNDLLIITADTNQDESLIIPAYNCISAKKFIAGCLSYFVKLNPLFNPYKDFLEPNASWNKQKSYVDYHFIAKEDFSFSYANYGNINIKKDQILRGIKSRKPTEKRLFDLIKSHDLVVSDVLSNTNKMKMFICSLK